MSENFVFECLKKEKKRGIQQISSPEVESLEGLVFFFPPPLSFPPPVVARVALLTKRCTENSTLLVHEMSAMLNKAWYTSTAGPEMFESHWGINICRENW